MCGVFGIFGHPEAAKLTYLGLHGIQHRGQESAGIVAAEKDRLYSIRDMGLVGDIFTSERLRFLPGSTAIGHVRYSTAGASRLAEAQPFAVDCIHGSIALAHNGNIVDGEDQRLALESMGSIFRSTADTEVVIHLMARSRSSDLGGQLADALRQVQGTYAIVALSENTMAAVRDPMGIRPLVLGRLDGAYVVASESSSFRLLGAEMVRDVAPGEMLVIDKNGLQSFRPFPLVSPRFCVFEQIYFARPDSVLENRSVYLDRERMGQRLAQEHAVDADIVVPVPDSGMTSALGYSKESGIPLAMGLIRSHYVGRTFIEPEQSIRLFGVKLKLSAVAGVLEGKRVIVIDDSIVRGTTSKKIVKLIRNAGAKEVHLRISSPPTSHSCFYGIDTPHRRELIAANHSTEEIARYATADTLGYLSREGLMWAVGDQSGKNHCDACFSGDYPIKKTQVQTRSRQLRLVST